MHSRKPFPLLEALPKSLLGVTLDFLWSHDRLWALELPVQHVAVHQLRWQLALPMWSFDGLPFAVSPQEVRADPVRYRVQYARTMAADLTFPLDALAQSCGRLVVLDGMHRLLKADLLGHATIAVRGLPLSRVDEIAA